ncbi:MAG: hypothetical protein K6F81_00720 [Acholeplasmatales bacterium]|nr:hypothetical protein [Acholeplasmatales bacterium]
MAKNQKKLDAPIKLKVLFTIVNRNKADFYMDALETFDVNFQALIYGTNFLFDSIGEKKIDHDSAVIISIVQEEKIPEILASYEDKYFKTRNGKGYGFVVPMDSIIGVLAYKYLANIGVE